MKNIKLYEEFLGFGKPKIPEKYNYIYKKLKNIFSGKYKINFDPEWKKFYTDKFESENVITIRGKDDYKPFFYQRKGETKKRFSGSGLLTFYLDRNYDNIKNWVDNVTPDKSNDVDYFLDNFDAFQGRDVPIEPTQEKPYEFIDLD